MFQPMDYTIEIVLLMGAILLGFHVYVKYFRIDYKSDGDKILEAYLNLEKARNGKK